MKKTTYIIIAAIVAGAVGVSFLSAYMFGFGNTHAICVDLTGTDSTRRSTIEMERFSTLIVNDSERYHWNSSKTGEFTLRISENDSISRPLLSVTSGVENYVSVEKCGNDTLKICMRYPNAKRMSEVKVTTGDLQFNLEVPAGMMRAVLTNASELGFNAVCIDGVRCEALTLSRLVPTRLSDCYIGCLTSEKYDMRYDTYSTVKLQLDATRIDTLKLKNVWEEMSLCGSADAYVGLVQPVADSGVKMEMRLTVYNCKIGEIKWEGSPDATFSVASYEPFNVTCP